MTGLTKAGLPNKSRSYGAQSFLVWLVVYFLVGYVVLDFLVDRIPESTSLKVNDPSFWDLKEVYANRLSEVRSRGGYSILMLGSSKTQFGFRGETVEAAIREDSTNTPLAFGFGLPGMGPLYQWTCAKRLERMGLLPDIVLLEVHGALFIEASGSGPGITRELGWLSRERVLSKEWMDLASIGVTACMKSGMMPIWFENRFTLLAPIRALIQKVDSGPKKPRNVIDRFGGPRLPTDADADNPRVKSLSNLDKTREEYSEMVGNFPPGSGESIGPQDLFGPAWESLKSTIHMLRKNGCRVILVRMPEGPAFRSWYAPNLAQVEAIKFRSFLLPEAKDWIDAREWFEEDKFWDSNHLNPKGAQIFSERLAREILSVANNQR